MGLSCFKPTRPHWKAMLWKVTPPLSHFYIALGRTRLILFSHRYKHQLSPEIIKEPWKNEEDLAILAAQAQVGNKWTEMWVRLPSPSPPSWCGYMCYLDLMPDFLWWTVQELFLAGMSIPSKNIGPSVCDSLCPGPATRLKIDGIGWYLQTAKMFSIPSSFRMQTFSG